MSTSISSPSSAGPAATATAAGGAPKNNRTVRRWVTVVSTLFFILLMFLVVRIQGHVSGAEFAPSHFQQRSFSFYEIPLLHVQITPIRRAGNTPTTATYVRQKSLIKTLPGAPETWHLVSISRGLTGTTPADANLLIDQLKFSTGGNDYWRNWSVDHPNHAKIVWPTIQKLAQRELYILMPSLFEIVQREQTPAELQANIDQYLSQRYVSLIQDMRAADRPELAEQLLAEAVADYPRNVELKQLRLAPTE